jgi:hypothetical protein
MRDDVANKKGFLGIFVLKYEIYREQYLKIYKGIYSREKYLFVDQRRQLLLQLVTMTAFVFTNMQNITLRFIMIRIIFAIGTAQILSQV